MIPKRRNDDHRDANADNGVAAQAAKQFVTFMVQDQRYAVDILAVREIRVWTGATALPNAPAHLRGIINLRGVIVPVIDVRALFRLGASDATPTSVVVIVAAPAGLTGLLVDAVSDILGINADEMAALPPSASESQQALFLGLIPSDDGLIAVIDTTTLKTFTPDEKSLPAPKPETRHVA